MRKIVVSRDGASRWKRTSPWNSISGPPRCWAFRTRYSTFPFEEFQGVQQPLPLLLQGALGPRPLVHLAPQQVVGAGQFVGPRGQRLRRPFSLDAVAERPHQELAIDLLLDQVVLGAKLHRLQRDRLVHQPGQDDDRQVRDLRVELRKSLHAGAVGQVQVQQDGIERLGRQPPKALAQPPHPIQVDFSKPRLHFPQVFLDQADIAQIVLDQ
jgi:hypothetical protein